MYACVYVRARTIKSAIKYFSNESHKFQNDRPIDGDGSDCGGAALGRSGGSDIFVATCGKVHLRATPTPCEKQNENTSQRTAAAITTTTTPTTPTTNARRNDE